MTSGLGRFELGRPFPDRAHAVCVSLPTVRDLVGYEEKDPRVLETMVSGYPRFVRHSRIEQLIDYLDRKSGEDGMTRFLVSDQKACEEAILYCSADQAQVIREKGFSSLLVPKGTDQSERVSMFLQHSGIGISSRRAEDVLVREGQIQSAESTTLMDDPGGLVREIIAKAHGPEIFPEDVLLGSSGANAFYALFREASKQAESSGKDLWVRLGWLYLDTIEVMELLAGETVQIDDPRDFGKVEAIFNEYGPRIAGIVTEFPTNPLMQACDLQRIRSLCDKWNSLLVVDPTMTSPKNAKVSGLADVIVNSLTKYAGCEGDVMMGSLVFPCGSDRGRELLEGTVSRLCPPYRGDLLRMAEQIPLYNDFIEHANQSLPHIVRFLEGHSKVKAVYWAYQSSNQGNFEELAGPNRPGCVASFEVDGSFKDFYDNLPMLKSPSFGTQFSLCCPYVYLAHYKLVKSETGLEELKRAGLSPFLCRLSVGTEQPDQIIAAISEGLKALGE
tara:strand:- start:926 stop:2428 length:1503 start_codon:yes stop_codon:yes gene_type:complete